MSSKTDPAEHCQGRRGEEGEITIQETGLSESEQKVWVDLVSRGLSNSISGLSEMVGKEVRLYGSIEPRRILIKDAPYLLGGPEAMAVAVYLQVTGCASGHMILVYRPETAFGLIDLLLDHAPGTTAELGDMERSALGEMGNIVGSFFLNTLADATGLDLKPSPPAVMQDMVGSILDAALAEMLAESDDLLIVDTAFGTSDRQINGTFLVLPSSNLIRVVIQQGKAS